MSEPRPRRERGGSPAPSGKASPKRLRSAAIDPGGDGASRDASPLSKEAARTKSDRAMSGPAEVAPAGFTCPPCGRFVRTDLDGVLWRARSGSPARFCSPGCRQAAYRRRRAGAGEGVPLQRDGGRNRSLGVGTGHG